MDEARVVIAIAARRPFIRAAAGRVDREVRHDADGGTHRRGHAADIADALPCPTMFTSGNLSMTICPPGGALHESHAPAITG
jgi:hypothetical protein